MADHNNVQLKRTASLAYDDIANHETINTDSTGKFMFQSKTVNIDVIAQNNNPSIYLDNYLIICS